MWNRENKAKQLFINLLPAMYLHTSGSVSVYNELPSSFEITSSIQQDCSITPILFNFVNNENALADLQDAGGGMAISEKL